MTTRDHSELDQDIGAYLLGALPPLEAQRLEGHVRGCDICQQEIARLAPAVEALPRGVRQVEPPGSLKHDLMTTVRREAARSRESLRPGRGWSIRLRVPAVAVAASLAFGLAVGGGLGTLGGGNDAADTRTVPAEVDRVRMGNASGALVMPSDASGTAVLRMTDLPPAGEGKVYEVWVSTGGRVRPVSLFEPHTDGSAVAGVDADLDAADAVLVTRERRGGVANPTEDPVIAVSL